jgi:hypothetical protein
MEFKSQLHVQECVERWWSGRHISRHRQAHRKIRRNKNSKRYSI